MGALATVINSSSSAESPSQLCVETSVRDAFVYGLSEINSGTFADEMNTKSLIAAELQFSIFGEI